jgi:hypothetical protein
MYGANFILQAIERSVTSLSLNGGSMTAAELLIKSVRLATQLEMQSEEDVVTPFIVLFNPVTDSSEVICLGYEDAEELLEELKEALRKGWEPVAIELCEGDDPKTDEFPCLGWMYFSKDPSLDHQAIMDSLHDPDMGEGTEPFPSEI